MNTQKLRTAEYTRSQLVEMLSELSDEALVYVKLPILYAYYWTDDHDVDRMTLEDSERFSLIRAAIHDPLSMVKSLCSINLGMQMAECEKKKGA